MLILVPVNMWRTLDMNSRSCELLQTLVNVIPTVLYTPPVHLFPVNLVAFWAFRVTHL
ncbi:hypothetical protein B0O80DRAFT_460921 [Mortierella sp. GBAus27b]|nr:hypothetical protein B0O80DRAFT_460921 [Mortierella sp. GBAus27b]